MLRFLQPGGRFVFILGCALGLALLFKQTPLYSRMDLRFFDWVHAVTAPALYFNDTLIIDVDDQSMANLQPALGAWPYDRDVFAELTRYLTDAGAKSVVYDVVFPEPRNGDGAFVEALRHSGKVLLGARGLELKASASPELLAHLDALAWPVAGDNDAYEWPNFLLPHASLTGTQAEIARSGVLSVIPDSDGILRRIPLMHKIHDRYLPAMWLAALYAGQEPPQVTYRRSAGTLAVGDRSWPVDEHGMMLLKFPRNEDHIKLVPFDRAVLASVGEPGYELTGDFDPRGKTVFVGSSAAVFGDYAQIPVHGLMRGLGILALAHANMRHELAIEPAPWPWDGLVFILAALLPLLVSNRRNASELWIGVAGGLGLLSALTVHVALFGQLNQLSAISFPLTTGVFALAVQFLVRIKTLYDDRQRLYYEKMAADEASALKSQFLSHMTHELRTPLTAVMGYNRLLAEDEISREERGRQVEIIDKNCKHLLSLINNLLDQAKIEAGQMTLDVRPVRIRSLIDDVADTLKPLAQEKGLSLRVAYADGIPAGLSVDELRLRQIIINLTGNALKFTEQGGVTLEVEWNDGRFRVAVRDTGPGMSEAALAKIFEAFQQADNTVATTHGGTGLGLTISRNLAELMGGDISATSILGEGTTFTLAVPAGATEPLRPPAPVVEQAAAAPEQLVGRVLIADDTPDIRNLLSLYLKKMGLDVLLAENGKEALDVALEEQPDLVFMDMQMPVMDGLEAVRALREAGFERTILALTAQTDQAQIKATLDAGCDGYAEKPISRARLKDIVHEHLDQTSEAPKQVSAN